MSKHTTSMWQSWDLRITACHQLIHICKLAAKFDPRLCLGLCRWSELVIIIYTFGSKLSVTEKLVPTLGWAWELWFSGLHSAHCIHLHSLPGLGGRLVLTSIVSPSCITLSSVLFHLIMLLWWFCSQMTLSQIRCLSELRCNLLQAFLPHRFLVFLQPVRCIDPLSPQSKA